MLLEAKNWWGPCFKEKSNKRGGGAFTAKDGRKKDGNSAKKGKVSRGAVLSSEFENDHCATLQI